MKKLLAFAVVALACQISLAQTLARGVNVSGLAANRDTTSGVTTITGTVTNVSDRLIDALSVTFKLYDEQNKEEGSTTDSTSQLAPGAVWNVQAETSTPFTRFSAMDVVAK